MVLTLYKKKCPNSIISCQLLINKNLSTTRNILRREFQRELGHRSFRAISEPPPHAQQTALTFRSIKPTAAASSQFSCSSQFLHLFHPRKTTQPKGCLKGNEIYTSSICSWRGGGTEKKKQGKWKHRRWKRRRQHRAIVLCNRIKVRRLIETWMLVWRKKSKQNEIVCSNDLFTTVSFITAVTACVYAITVIFLQDTSPVVTLKLTICAFC